MSPISSFLFLWSGRLNTWCSTRGQKKCKCKWNRSCWWWSSTEWRCSPNLPPILRPVYSIYIARHFLQVISCVDHTCRSVALASFWLYISVHVLLSSKLSGVRTSRTLKRTCTIRLLFLLIHRKGTVNKDISKASVAPISAQELDHIWRSLKNEKC